MKDQDIVAPRYADPGRKERVESFGCRSAIAWHEHTQKHNLRFDTLADDTVSTRESCCKPDVMTNGRATELMMTDWGDYSFPLLHYRPKTTLQMKVKVAKGIIYPILFLEYCCKKLKKMF